MPGRIYSNGSDYRYGFNGKEKDAETAVDDYDYGARIYDARIGRWFSVDPLMKKYPSISPYAFAVNNPNFYYDIDGKDVGVSIVRNPQGGGTITFSTTTYVTGINAEQKVAAFNEAYKAFVKANPNMKSSDGKWDIEIKMNFVNANDIKHQVAEKQEMAAENYMNVKAPSDGDSRAHSGMAYPNSSDGTLIREIDEKGNNGKGLLLASYPASGRFAQLYSGDDGRTGVHEELHNWGIGDYYADVTYDQTILWDNKFNSKTLGSSQIAGTSTSFVGFEDDIMSAGSGFCMSQEHVDDLINAALNTSATKKSDNFVMARKVDQARPNGNTRVDQVPKTTTTVNPNGRQKTIKSNPQYKSAGK